MSGAKKYVLTTYITFWLMVLGICGTASMVFHAPPLVMRIFANLCAWSPTIVLFVMFKKLLPETKRLDFLKKSFSGKINAAKLAGACGATVAFILLSVFICALFEKKDFALYFTPIKFSGLPLAIFLSLTSGPTGEELGWRGYLKGELEKKFGFVQSAVRLGTTWAFWHAVLWAVDSDFLGAEMVVYIISNVVVMISLTMIMFWAMGSGGNVACAMAVHFCFNFTYVFLNAGILVYAVMTVVFALAATVVAIAVKKLKGEV